MIPICLPEPYTGFIQACGDDLLVALTNTGRFYNLQRSYYDVKIHESEELFGQCDSSLTTLAKQIIKLSGCRQLYLQTGMLSFEGNQIKMIIASLEQILGNENPHQ